MNSLTDPYTFAEEEDALPVLSSLHEPEDIAGLFALIDALCAEGSKNDAK